jgi:hypothetical protein
VSEKRGEDRTDEWTLSDMSGVLEVMRSLLRCRVSWLRVLRGYRADQNSSESSGSSDEVNEIAMLCFQQKFMCYIATLSC